MPVAAYGTARSDLSLRGSNGAKSTVRAWPSMISSAIASPVAGALSMPQTLWPVATYAPETPGTGPISGRPSAVTGRKHACSARILAVANVGDMSRQMARRRGIAPASGSTAAASAGSRLWLDIAQT